MLKYVPALALVLAAGPVFAQGASMTPPAPGAAASEPQSANSMPPGTANMNLNSTANPHLAGQAVGGTTTTTTAPRPGLGAPTTQPASR